MEWLHSGKREQLEKDPKAAAPLLGAGEQRGELRERLEETKGNIRGQGQISHRGTRTQDPGWGGGFYVEYNGERLQGLEQRVTYVSGFRWVLLPTC